MLEIGCNVVVLDLDTYETLKKRADKADRMVEGIMENMIIKPSYDAQHIDVVLNGDVIQSIIQKKWDETGLGAQYELREDKSYWALCNQYYMAELKPEPQEVEFDEYADIEIEVKEDDPF